MLPVLDADTTEDYIVAAARVSFWAFCRFRAPAFYRPERKYLKAICDMLQALVEDRLVNEFGDPLAGLILNMPPRHGKTRTAILLSQWFLGRWPTRGIYAACYNETLSGRFAKGVRDGIQEVKGDSDHLVYSDYFPGVAIKQGDAAMAFWSLEGSHFSFLATSPGGTLTGVGAHLAIIDDLIKNADEAYNERVLEEHWDWYTNTTLSRLENGAKQLIIQTRWATKDLTGRLLEDDPNGWGVLCEPAYNESTGEMLCPDILSLEEYRKREGKTDPVIFQSNYQQKPFDAVDKLYGKFKTYATLPKFRDVHAYVDTADKGSDFLAGAAYGVTDDNIAYVLDVLYTLEGMEKTEMQMADMLANAGVREAYIESNNGGEGFARNVGKLMVKNGYTKCSVITFHQGGNKETRILTNATSVMNCVVMPEDWATRWPLFYRDVTRLGRSGKWLHDDAPDMLSGIIEKSIENRVAFSFG